MAKKMSLSKTTLDNLEKGQKFRNEYPNPVEVKKTFENMRRDLKYLIKSSEMTRSDVARKLGMSENLLFGKMNHPHRWKMNEIEIIIKLLY